MNLNNFTKDMWKMALRDPAYLLLMGISISVNIYCIYLMIK